MTPTGKGSIARHFDVCFPLYNFTTGCEEDCSRHKDQRDALDQQLKELEGLIGPDSVVEADLTQAYWEDTKVS